MRLIIIEDEEDLADLYDDDLARTATALGENFRQRGAE